MCYFKYFGWAILFVLLGCRLAGVKMQSASRLLQENPILVDFLSENQLLVLEGLVSVDVYVIEPQLIKGTDNEYSNKSVFLKTLTTSEKLSFLNAIIKDGNYNWNSKDVLSYNPSLQFVLKDESSQFLIQFSENSKEIGILDLEGQKTVSVELYLFNFLKTNYL